MQYWQSFYADPAKLKGARLGILGRAWRFARPDRWRLVIYLLLTTASTLLVLAPPLIGRSIIDDTLLHPDQHRLVFLVLILLLASLVGALATFAGGLQGQHVGIWVIYRMRSALYDHIQRLPLAFFTRTQTGKLSTRLSQDVGQAQQLFTGTLSTVLTDVLVLVFTIPVVLSLSWQVGVAAVALAPFLVAASELVGRRTRVLYRDQLKLWGDMNTKVVERFNASGALLVKLFGRPRAELVEYQDVTAQLSQTALRMYMLQAGFGVSLSLIPSLALVAVYAIGGGQVIGHHMSVGTLVALAALVQRLYQPILDLTSTRISLAQQLVSFERVFEVLDVPNAIVEKPAALDLEVVRGEIAFEDVSFRYPAPATFSLASLEADDAAPLSHEPGELILDGIALHVPAGSMTAVVGYSGSGKTTICNLVPRLYDVSSGRVTVDGHDVRDLTLESLRECVAMVPQDPFLFHDSVAANLRYARPGASDEELQAACRAARIGDLIEGLPDQYETVVGERGYRFSGGEKQRLAIARLFLKNPAIIILDEATSSLDTETEALVQEALAELLEGRTSLVVAHRLSTVRRADQIVVVSAGRVVETGTHDSLREAGGVYAGLYGVELRQRADETRELAS